MVALKNNHARFDESSYTIPQMVAYWCTIMSHSDRFFDKSAMLIPIPSHHPTKPESLWVPKVIADSLKQNGLGCDVVTCLERTGLVQQSSRSASQDRPTVKTHYSTLKIKDRIDMVPQDISLVDDVITRGTTIAAAYIRLAEAYPNARIKAFAAMSTTFPDQFKDVIDPRTGTIVLGEQYPQKKNSITKGIIHEINTNRYQYRLFLTPLLVVRTVFVCRFKYLWMTFPAALYLMLYTAFMST